MVDPISFDWRSLHIAEASLIVAILASLATLIISWMALQAARSANQIAEGSLKEAKTATDLAEESLRQATVIAERELADWRQSKWLELYFRANDACKALEYFQMMHLPKTSEYRYSEPVNTDYNNFIHLNRQCLAMAAVFPKNEVIDKLAGAAAAFKDWEEAFSKERLTLIADAVEDLRVFAILRSEVLMPPEMREQIKKSMIGKFDKIGP